MTPSSDRIDRLSVVGAALDRPDGIAFLSPPGATTYARLARRVSGAVRELRSRGLEPGVPGALVALTPRPTVEAIVPLLACIELGVPFVALHPRAPEAERRRLLDAVRPTLVVAPDEVFGASCAPEPPSPIPSETPLAVLFTSGTSGTPKPVVLSRRAFLASADASAERLPLDSTDRWLLALPPAHVGGLSVLTRSLIARSTVTLAGDGPFDPAAFARAIDGGATLVSVVPTTLRRLLDLEPRYVPPPTLRVVLVGGAAAAPSLLAEALERGFPVRATYGLTEACSQVATQVRPDEPGVGRPLPGTEVRIVDGQIEVRSRTLLSGYWPLGAAPSPLDADGFFATSDLGELDANGCLHVHARRSDLVVTGGENVYPAEVEAAALAIAGVAGVCVVGVDDRDLGQRVAAAVVLAVHGPDVEALRGALREQLAGFKVPRTIRFVDALPTLPSGKVDRRAVVRLLSDTTRAPD